MTDQLHSLDVRHQGEVQLLEELNLKAESLGTWLLVSTFDGRVGPVVARGDMPEQELGAVGLGQSLDRALKACGIGAAQKIVERLACPAVAAALGSLSARTSGPLQLRQDEMWAYADPVFAGDRRVFGVWLWIGSTPRPRSPHPLTGAWEWAIWTTPYEATYGENIGALYSVDLEPGRVYNPMGLVEGMQFDTDPVADLLANRRAAGERLGMKLTVNRKDAHPVSLRAATEIADGPNGSATIWRGMTWDITQWVPPVESPDRVLNRVLDQHWSALAYWDPIADRPVFLPRSGALPGDVAQDSVTNRVELHPDDKGVAGRMRSALAAVAVQEDVHSVVRLRTRTGEWGTYELAITPLRGLSTEAGLVRLRRFDVGSLGT